MMRRLFILAAIIAASFSVILGLPIVWQVAAYTLVSVMAMVLPRGRP